MPDASPSQRIAAGLAKIGLVLKSQAWRNAGERGLTPTQGQILAALLARAPAPMRLSELAAALAIRPATASDAVSALLEKGLVRRARMPEDARALALTLSAKGRREAKRVSHWPDFLLPAVDALSAGEQEAFLLALVKMIRSLQDQGRIPVARMCVNCRFFEPNRWADPQRPHHCNFVDAPFGPRDLRLDCADFQPALVSIQNANHHALFQQ
jgi:DNA-binding MarR family transcriptional regulator